MSKRKKGAPKERNAQAYAARMLCRGGAHADGRDKRQRTRATKRRAAIAAQLGVR